MAPVRSMEAALDEGELRQRSMLVAYAHPVLGEVKTVGLPIRMQGYEPTYRPAPALDADRLQVLASVGYDAPGIEALRQRGAFGHA